MDVLKTRKFPSAISLCLCGSILTGCVDRRISITSNPPGAQVFLNDADVGRTPLEVNFTYFGTYDVRLRKEGYEPLVTKAKASAPIHEWPGVDLLFLPMPFTKETRIAWHFDMQPTATDPMGTVQRATELRAQLEGASHGDTQTPSSPAESAKSLPNDHDAMPSAQ